MLFCVFSCILSTVLINGRRSGNFLSKVYLEDTWLSRSVLFCVIHFRQSGSTSKVHADLKPFEIDFRKKFLWCERFLSVEWIMPSRELSTVLLLLQQVAEIRSQKIDWDWCLTRHKIVHLETLVWRQRKDSPRSVSRFLSPVSILYFLWFASFRVRQISTLGLHISSRRHHPSHSISLQEPTTTSFPQIV